AEALRHVASMLAPLIPSSAREIWRRLGAPGDPFAGYLGDGEVAWGFPSGSPLMHDVAGLFPRLDKTTFFADARSADTGRSPAGIEKEAAARADARVGAAAVA